ncbi:MAG: hypothetical protein ACI8XO_003839 [Verrucomicrobiales bacterium]
MLEFTDKPYQFFPPNPSPTVIRIAHWLNHQIILPGPNHRISELQIDGDERLRELIASGAHILFLPNHSTHSDPHIMSEVHRQLGIPSAFMAAYDVFLRSKLNAWVIQRTGSFSVDREGSDRKAMSTAIEVLKSVRSLTVFPEGNVYFTNDRITAFLEGAAFIGVKAQKDLGDAPVYAVPVAIKATHLVDQRAAVLDRIDKAAAMAGCACDRGGDPLLELRRIGQLALENHLLEHDFDIPNDSQPIHDTLEEAAATLINSLESEIGLKPKTGDSLIDRVRKIRSKIHQVRIGSRSEVSTEKATAWADRAILALRILGYTGNYCAENPSVDRFAETAEKLIEDLHSKLQKPYGKRRALVRLCEPIDLRDHRGRGVVESVTREVEAAVQDAIDAINATNSSAGSQPF